MSELRQDIVSGDWVVIAVGRSHRPHAGKKNSLFKQPARLCPFKELAEPLVLYTHDGAHEALSRSAASWHPCTSRIRGAEWWVVVVPNKYPAFFSKGVCAVFRAKGPYRLTDGVGFHEVVITKDHERSIAEMSDEEVELVLRAYQDRYLALKKDDCVKYISVFHNHGREAGATISHPHSQIIAVPIIPSDVGRSLKGASDFFHKHKQCVHCVILEYEMKIKERIVYENDACIVVTPYASRTAFELRIYPKRHNAYFEEIPSGERRALANALRITLAKLYGGLENPDYNFFLHTAPIEGSKEFGHYHWHFEILPKTSVWAGFEIGTGIEIAVVTPEEATEMLRKIKV
ncbi:MAG: hypothetical protein A3C07_03500 [Candidatus Sungbacteria bacterium RIFCSPHIGHO2_02_FULL_47_11]|uniref:Uncharacterized protein n=1 Tax=Candidatus Sungbacteria bacterium RIFCSPHIGHO2_02_FULL_47_11 TaxID=1802270 RepID=A0A1G2KPG7_9BACT|nr:MAG: hypothetical protein A3C07_03500 [Candidatus Sungbacteria bacterium RIFCSPHIGHO2_02_FULL_47_11]